MSASMRIVRLKDGPLNDVLATVEYGTFRVSTSLGVLTGIVSAMASSEPAIMYQDDRGSGVFTFRSSEIWEDYVKEHHRGKEEDAIAFIRAQMGLPFVTVKKGSKK